MKAKTVKTKRYPLDFGGEMSAAWSGQPLPAVKSYAGYPITFRDEPAGEGHVERDPSGQLWVRPSFAIAFDEVKFRAFWRAKDEKAILIVMVARESPTQPWV